MRQTRASTQVLNFPSRDYKTSWRGNEKQKLNNSTDDKAQDLHDTAQLEEKQFNKPHAINLRAGRIRTSRFVSRKSAEDWFGRVGESAL